MGDHLAGVTPPCFMSAAILITALVPVLLLIGFIRYQDRSHPEPARQLLRAFGLGVFSVLLSFCVSIPCALMGVFTNHPSTVTEAIGMSFLGAAIPEELAKFFMLWLVLRKNPFFDEKMDGIVYAVCVSLGFAALENALYLFDHADMYLALGIRRAIFSIPGHFCFGVMMGYYYSLARFDAHSRTRRRILILAAPILAHGLYDSFLFIADVSEAWGGLMSLCFLLFCYQMWKFASRRIVKHLRADGVIP